MVSFRRMYILPEIERSLLGKIYPDSFKTERLVRVAADQKYIYFMRSELSFSLRCKSV